LLLFSSYFVRFEESRLRDEKLEMRAWELYKETIDSSRGGQVNYRDVSRWSWEAARGFEEGK